MAKVVLISNFSDDSVSDVLVAEKLSKRKAEQQAEIWNKAHANHDSKYFAVVRADGYKLYKWEP